MDPIDKENENESFFLNCLAEKFKGPLDSLPISRAASKNLNSEESNNLKTTKINEECENSNLNEEGQISIKAIEWESNMKLNENEIEKDDDQEVPVVTRKNRVRCASSPISLLLEYSQKTSNGPAFAWEEFSENGYFGCRLNWGEKFWIAPARSGKKKEARTQVALMACTEIFGDVIQFEGIDPEIYFSWTKQSVRKDSDDLAVNKMSEKINFDANTSVNSTERISSSDKPFSALVNDFCQSKRLSLPVYEFSSVTQGSMPRFLCSVSNFHDLPPLKSEAMVSKKEAKNQVARMIYDRVGGIRTGRYFDNGGSNENNNDTDRIKHLSSSTSSSSASSNDLIAAMKVTSNTDPNTPIDPATMIPLVMTLLAQVSRFCYPNMTTMDGIYEMIHQWQDFLDWKSQKFEATTKENNINNSYDDFHEEES